MTTTNTTTANQSGRVSVSRSRWNSVVLFIGGALFGSLVAVSSQVMADQPNMRNALSSLRSARQFLQAATPNKGGHRAMAIQLTQQAIYQTQAGIQAGER